MAMQQKLKLEDYVMITKIVTYRWANVFGWNEKGACYLHLNILQLFVLLNFNKESLNCNEMLVLGDGERGGSGRSCYHCSVWSIKRTRNNELLSSSTRSEIYKCFERLVINPSSFCLTFCRMWEGSGCVLSAWSDVSTHAPAGSGSTGGELSRR